MLILAADAPPSLETIQTLARWAAILAGLSVVGVLWTLFNLGKLASNQVKLGVMLRELLDRPK